MTFENFYFSNGTSVLFPQNANIATPAAKINNEINCEVERDPTAVKSSTVKDANGTKFKTSSAGVVTEVDGTSDDGSDEARTPVEPTYWED